MGAMEHLKAFELTTGKGPDRMWDRMTELYKDHAKNGDTDAFLKRLLNFFRQTPLPQDFFQKGVFPARGFLNGTALSSPTSLRFSL